jgi:lysophospholipid acyltransferase (LPLAT)-like uncharacterized protein
LAKKKKLKKRIKQKLMLWFLPLPIYLLSRLLDASLKKEYRDCDELLEKWRKDEPLIMAFWHNRILLGGSFYLFLGNKPTKILVSPSFDGMLGSRVFKFFGPAVAYGSSSRKGEEGMQDMIEYGKKGYRLAMTPDGPLGPMCRVKPGAIHMARETGLPIYSMSYYADKVTRVDTWDKFVFVRPFSRVLFMGGKPITVSPDADEEMIEKKRKELEDELNRISRFTENYYADEEKNSA